MHLGIFKNIFENVFVRAHARRQLIKLLQQSIGQFAINTQLLELVGQSEVEYSWQVAVESLNKTLLKYV